MSVRILEIVCYDSFGIANLNYVWQVNLYSFLNARTKTITF